MTDCHEHKRKWSNIKITHQGEELADGVHVGDHGLVPGHELPGHGGQVRAQPPRHLLRPPVLLKQLLVLGFVIAASCDSLRNLRQY